MRYPQQAHARRSAARFIFAKDAAFVAAMPPTSAVKRSAGRNSGLRLADKIQPPSKHRRSPGTTAPLDDKLRRSDGPGAGEKNLRRAGLPRDWPIAVALG